MKISEYRISDRVQIIGKELEYPLSWEIREFIMKDSIKAGIVLQHPITKDTLKCEDSSTLELHKQNIAEQLMLSVKIQMVNLVKSTKELAKNETIVQDKVSAVEKSLLKKSCKNRARQGFEHKAKMTEYFQFMIEAAQAEFNEDNWPTIEDLVDGCYEEAKDNIKHLREALAVKHDASNDVVPTDVATDTPDATFSNASTDVAADTTDSSDTVQESDVVEIIPQDVPNPSVKKAKKPKKVEK